MGGFSLELKTFSWEEVHKVEKIEGNQTEEEDKEKAEDESRGADNHVHFDFLGACVVGSNKLEGANCRIDRRRIGDSQVMHDWYIEGVW